MVCSCSKCTWQTADRLAGAPRGTKFVPHSIEDQVRLAYSTPTPHVGTLTSVFTFEFCSSGLALEQPPCPAKVYRPIDPRHPDIAELGTQTETTFLIRKAFAQ